MANAVQREADFMRKFKIDPRYKPTMSAFLQYERHAYTRGKFWLIMSSFLWNENMHSIWPFFASMAGFRGFKVSFSRAVIVSRLSSSGSLTSHNRNLSVHLT
jgi:hypothetical protein